MTRMDVAHLSFNLTFIIKNSIHVSWICYLSVLHSPFNFLYLPEKYFLYAIDNGCIVVSGAINTSPFLANVLQSRIG